VTVVITGGATGIGSVLAVDGGRSLGQAMHSVAAEEA
jgi:short-subunit dehydrogenase involved in D-alanine esterification of teichoic acids